MSARLYPVDLVARYEQQHLVGRLVTPKGFNASALLSFEQTTNIEIIALSLSSVSVLAALCGIYWFLTMRRIFRRDLVLLLILGDFWKSFWYGTNAAYTLANGRPAEDAAFCQVSGYLLFTGIEACDWAIFFQALHMLLQVFPPKNDIFGSDGLYRVRRWVLAAWLILPNISASLAFVHAKHPYVSQGGFCTLPIRPIWYRIALSWAPRYLIVIFTLGVAMRIYRHVGFGFQVFRAAEGDDSTNRTGNASKVGGRSQPQESILMQHSVSAPIASSHTEKQLLESDHEEMLDEESQTSSGLRTFTHSHHRHPVNWSAPSSAGASVHLDQNTLSDDAPSSSRGANSSRRESRYGGVGFSSSDPPFPYSGLEDTRASWSSKHESHKSLDQKESLEPTPPAEAQDRAIRKPQREEYNAQNDMATRAMEVRRQAIQRQLRMLFIYPVVYLMLWVIPFVAHAMNYSNYYAQHPNYALRILNIADQCIMGFCDVAIFCWREKPWRHIPGSDGTFLGSFMFWRFKRRPSSSSRTSFPRHQPITIPGSVAVSSPAQENSRKSTRRLRSLFTRLDISSTAAPSRIPAASSPHHLEARGPQLYPPPPVHRAQTARRFGISDRRAMEVDAAHDRLRLERVDWEKRRLEQQQSQANSPAGANTPVDSNSIHLVSPTATVGRKEWWESRLMSIDDD